LIAIILLLTFNLAIVMGHQSVTEVALDVIQQFKHNLSLASTSRSDKQRKDALAFLTGQLSSHPPTNPVGTPTILSKLLPLISDGSTPVRSQLLKLLRVLPEAEVKHHAEKVVMYIRAGMTHLSSDVSSDSLSVLEWLLEVAEDEVVTCPGGWVKTMNSFCAMMGWSVSGNSGWSSGPKARIRTRDAHSTARLLSALTKFLQAGLKPEISIARNPNAYWDNMYRVPRNPDPFAYLNLFGSRRDEEGEMYADREARQRVFHKRFYELVMTGVEQAKKEGGANGRVAATLDQVLKTGMNDYEPSAAVEANDLLELW
jgi:pre-rRNA-processing protein IPI1